MTGGAIAPPLLAWWDLAGRKDLPWQREPTPYRVWVSEIMLQQTQVATVERYYDRFLDAFPDVVALADAEPDRVLHLWSGLGYYARARNLHRAARVVRDECGGELPCEFEELTALPGIGRSTAGAILALAHDRRYPILDGNARRVLARVFGVEGWTGSTANLKRLWQLADECTPDERAAHYTQAIMDLGATVCSRAARPACGTCPLTSACRACAAGRTGRIPGPRPKRARRQRTVVVVMLIRGDGAVLLERRPDAGVWGGLWCFPEAGHLDGVADWCRSRFGVSPGRIEVRPVVSHSFTHFDLDMTPVEAHVAGAPMRLMDGDHWLW
ncbi:MAG: A/G-specific adenine glycosylase, partial [Gammaproteobacteria bacterium]